MVVIVVTLDLETLVPIVARRLRLPFVVGVQLGVYLSVLTVLANLRRSASCSGRRLLICEIDGG